MPLQHPDESARDSSLDERGVYPSGPTRPWSLIDLLLFIVFSFCAIAFTGAFSLAAYGALKPLFGWTLPTKALAANTFFLLSVQMAAYALIFFYIYFLVVYHYRLPFWKGMKWGSLGRGKLLRYIAWGILLTIGIQITAALLPDHGSFPLERMFSSEDASYALAIFAVAIGPFMEELIFRGVLFSAFETRIGLTFAIIATAALFAAMHIPEYSGAWHHVLFIFAVGLVLSIIRGVTGSLAPCVVLHVTYNACLMVVLFFATSHFRVIQGALK